MQKYKTQAVAAVAVNTLRRRFTVVFITFIFALLALASTAKAETVVTTYVTKVQEERQTTRWTLTEWLKIKERMKMMDVWLAMFSNPDKDRFRPELNISYGMSRGTTNFTDASGESEQADVSGRSGRAQLWLTNILTGTVGVRTLNIDFGIEGYKRESGNFAPGGSDPSLDNGNSAAATKAGANTSTPAAASTISSLAANRAIENTYYTADLRIFGKNIQDSSVVLKYGRYDSTNTLPYEAESQEKFSGTVAGAELQLYLFKWLGFEGNYLAYGGSGGVNDKSERDGQYYDYLGFVEVSLLRFMVGRYREDWSFASDADADSAEKMQSSEEGLMAGMKLQF